MHRIPLQFRIALAFLASAVLLVLAMPRTVKFAYDYKKGQEWKYETLVSQFDFPILKTEEQIQKEKETSNSGIIPYYKFSEEALEKSVIAVEQAELGDFSQIKPVLTRALKNIYDRGVVSDEGVRQVNPSADVDVLYVQRGRRAAKMPVSEVFRLSEAKAHLRSTVQASGLPQKADSIVAAAGIYDIITPNLVFDQTNTNLVHSSSEKAISPTMGYVSAGQLIVSNGELVTAEIAQILDSYRKEYDANIGYDGPKIIYWLGNVLMAVVLLAILFFAVFLTDKKIFRDNRIYYILLMFVSASLAALMVERLGSNFLYLVPFTVFALYLQSFFRLKVIVPVYTVSLLPLMIFSHNGLTLAVMFLLAGFVAMYCYQTMGKGWKQFLAALITYAVLLVVYFGFRLLGMAGGDIIRVLIFLFIGSMLTVAAYPLVFLFEKIFNLVSSMRLEELSNTGNPLIRKLELLAPGTFQHSLQVMHMAAAAARAVGGDVTLIRAGALYHDIGKMQNPQCFVENESLIALDSSSKYHQGLDPLQSAQDIIRHVNDGMELAAHNNVPSIVSDFILSHHGTTLVSYFYNKYLEQGGDPALVGEFRYNGHKPHSKEQIILMICDSIEAASRTLPSYDTDTFDGFVEKIVASKMEQGQFDNADITIRELGVVKSVIKSHLSQIYHERIVYPERKSK